MTKHHSLLHFWIPFLIPHLLTHLEIWEQYPKIKIRGNITRKFQDKLAYIHVYKCNNEVFFATSYAYHTLNIST